MIKEYIEQIIQDYKNDIENMNIKINIDSMEVNKLYKSADFYSNLIEQNYNGLKEYYQDLYYKTNEISQELWEKVVDLIGNKSKASFGVLYLCPKLRRIP